jgi:hypothetical protein
LSANPLVRSVAQIGLAWLVTGCTEATLTPLENNYGAVSIKATDQTGAPVPGTSVELRSPQRLIARATADVEGEVLFEYIPPGLYFVDMRAPDDYAIPLEDPFEPVPVQVEAGAVSGVPLTLTSEVGRVRVTVVDLEGNPVGGIYMNLQIPDTIHHVAATPAAGVHVFTSIHQGTYIIDWGAPEGLVAAPGQPDPILNVTVADDEVTDVTITLARTG